MLFSRLVHTGELEVGGRLYPVRYFETKTMRGTLRYSCEVVLGPADRIIVDGNSLNDVESKAVRLVPATIYSRALARRGRAA